MQEHDTSREDELEESLVKTLMKSDLMDIVKDAAEIGLDSVLRDAPFKELPIVNWIVGAGKTVVAVRDRFLLRKVKRFLERLASVPEDERSRMVDRIEQDEGYSQRIAETILLYLDRYDHLDKADLLSRLFIAYGREELERDDFIRLAASIDRAYIQDLNMMLEYFSAENPGEVNLQATKRNVSSSDLSDFYVLTEQEFESSGMEHPQVYHFNPMALKLAKIVLGDSFREGRW